MATHQITVEELTGLTHGLTDVIKDQTTQSKLYQGATDQQIEGLAKAVSDLTNTSPAASTTTERLQTLPLPQVNLPSFNGETKNDSECFLEQLTTLLISSGVPSRHYFTYLKQWIHKQARTYDFMNTFVVSNIQSSSWNVVQNDSVESTWSVNVLNKL